MRKRIIQLTVPGEPQGKQRAKSARIGTGPKAYIKTYTPERTVNYETYIKQLFVVKYPDFVPVEGALELELTASCTIPASTSKKRKALMESNEIRPTKRPDVDNLVKIVMDALESLAYKNDSQIVDESTHKFFSIRPGLDIKIYEI